jgi:antagonist of KipI
MSLLVIKPGLLDTFQDEGRFGYQALGINPGGAMDRVSMQIANMLVNNLPDTPVLEMHFPAAVLQAEQDMVIALAGADFDAHINDQPVPVHHPVVITKNSFIRFQGKKQGARVYLAVMGGFQLSAWLNSYSTHLKVKAGGYEGRALQKNDRIHLQQKIPAALSINHAVTALPWQASVPVVKSKIAFIPGAEYELLDPASQSIFSDSAFIIRNNSDRMGFRLQGTPLRLQQPVEMVSTGVTRGTIQLLPDGQLIILMADHQTTGGYPRIGHITSACFSVLAQHSPAESIRFTCSDLAAAHAALREQQMNLRQLQNACNFRWKDILKS